MRIDEDMQVIEGRDQPDVPGLQHAVAEYISRHVADSGNGKVLLLDVDAHLAKMTLHAFPGAARGDRHLLVVIAGRAAGSECIAEPEAVFLGNGVGDVGKGGGALVRGDHQVSIVLVVANDQGRSDDLLVDDVVGNIQ